MATLLVGALINNHEILEVSDRMPNTSNRRVKIRCLTCETTSEVWSTVLQKNQKRCKYCYSVKHGSDLERTRPLAILKEDLTLTILWRNSTNPEEVTLAPGERLMVARDNTTFSPYLEGEDLTKPAQRVIPLPPTTRPRPPPDPHFPARLAVPFVFLPYYLGESAACADEAQAFYDKRVKQKTPDIYSSHAAGTTLPWDEDGQQWAYLYFTDDYSTITEDMECQDHNEI